MARPCGRNHQLRSASVLVDPKEAQFSTYQSIAYDRKMITDKAMWELMWEGSSTQVSTRAAKMASMASSSPRVSEGESSAEECDSTIENEIEKFEKDANQRNQEENNTPKKKKKRVAGDRSGRQLALRRITAEKKKNLWETFGPPVPSFADVAKASREVLLEFAEDSDISEEHASSMRVYMNKKLSVSTTVSYMNKVFLLPS